MYIKKYKTSETKISLFCGHIDVSYVSCLLLYDLLSVVLTTEKEKK